MADSSRQTARSSNSETIIGSHLLGDTARNWDITRSVRSEEIIAVRDRYGYEESNLGDGEFNASAWWRSDEKAFAFRSDWLAAMRDGHTLFPFAWTLGNEFAVGEDVGAAFLRPRDMMFPTNATTSQQKRFNARLVCEIFEGGLQSTSGFPAGTDVVHGANLNGTALPINTVGPNFYSPTIALSNTEDRDVLVGVTVTELDGHTGTAPTATLAFTTTTLGAAFNGQAVTVTHDSEQRSTLVLSQGDRVGRLIQELNGLTWADGFRISARGNYHPQTGALQSITITGNLVGAGESFTLGGPAPFSGTYTGSGNTTQARLVSATGSGGSRVYTQLTDLVDIDDHDLPVTFCAIAPKGISQFGIHVVTPVGQSAYSYNVDYVPWWMIEGRS